MDNFALPDGIKWIETGIIKCDGCKVIKDCRNGGPEGYLAFVKNHKGCKSERTLSQMTLKEHIRLTLVNSLIQSNYFAGLSAPMFIRNVLDFSETLTTAFLYQDEPITEKEFEALERATRQISPNM